MPSTPFTMRVDADLKAALEAEAKRADISASQLATQAIRAHLEAQAIRRDAIEAAVADADKGTFISSDAMLAWVDSWGHDAEPTMPASDIEA